MYAGECDSYFLVQKAFLPFPWRHVGDQYYGCVRDHCSGVGDVRHHFLFVQIAFGVVTGIGQDFVAGLDKSQQSRCIWHTHCQLCGEQEHYIDSW